MTTKTKNALAKIGKDKKTREILRYMATHKRVFANVRNKSRGRIIPRW